MKTLQNQRILKLRVQNVKGVTDAVVEPGENSLVVIGGRNGQGKSSVLDSIVYALGGKKAMPKEPIRQGEDDAEIVLELEDVVVTRRMTAKTDRLEVCSREGAKFKSPQAMLDRLVGRLSFDPLAFARLGETAAGRREQAELVMQLGGLDFSELDAKRQAAFDKRTDINRDLKNVRARLEQMPHHEDAPEEEVSVTDLAGELQKAQDHNSAIDRVRDAATDARITAGEIAEEIEQLQERIKEREVAFEAAKKEAEAKDKERVELGDEIDAAPIIERMRGAEEANSKVRENHAHDAEAEALQKLAQEADALTTKLQDLDEEKAAAIRKAELPVAGLGFTEDGLSLNDIPFNQASASEKLRTSVAMGMAANPGLRVMLIDQGSELDPANMGLLAEMAEEAEAQIWMCRVSEGEECTVIMENGQVKGAAAAAAAVEA